MDKFTLQQYSRLKKELPDVRKRADRAEKELKRLEDIQEMETVKDIVKGGEGGWQTYHIEGIPSGIGIEQARSALRSRIRLLNLQVEECTELMKLTETFIASISDSEVRQIIRHRFIDGATWENVAARMGYGYSEDSVRKIFERFMAEE